MRLTEEQCWNQLGYYGVALNIKDDLPLVLPEQVITDSLQYIENLDYSKMFSLIVDFMIIHHDFLRSDVFVKASKNISNREKRILCGLLEISDARKFSKVIERLSSDIDLNTETRLGSEGRINSYGIDPIMKKYGVVCSVINKTRSDKKIFSKKDLIKFCPFFKYRALIGPNARADYLSFRDLRVDLKNAEVRRVTNTTKSSSVYYEQIHKLKPLTLN